LQNSRLLTLLQERQKNNLTIWEFKRVVMMYRFVFVDLPEHCGSMLDNALTPRPKSCRSNFLSETQFGAW
jgi:hypothetical protein